MHRGLPGSNTKLVLVLTRLWALLTLSRVFGCSSGSFFLQDASTQHRLVVRFRQHVLHVYTLYVDMQRGECMIIKKTTHDALVLMMQCNDKKDLTGQSFIE